MSAEARARDLADGRAVFGDPMRKPWSHMNISERDEWVARHGSPKEA